MKYIHRDEVKPELAAESKREIEALNNYLNDLHGTVVAIKRIRSGQPRPYADSVDEAVIFCFQPNVLTTNGPLVRSITRTQAEQLAKMFVTSWRDKPQFLESRLNFLEPIPNPCEIREYPNRPGEEPRASAWHIQVTHPYCD